jgi:hypothetical protein
MARDHLVRGISRQHLAGLQLSARFQNPSLRQASSLLWEESR